MAIGVGLQENHTNKARLFVSKDTIFIIENQDRLEAFKNTATKETLMKVCNELMYLAAMTSNLAVKLSD